MGIQTEQFRPLRCKQDHIQTTMYYHMARWWLKSLTHGEKSHGGQNQEIEYEVWKKCPLTTTRGKVLAYLGM